MTHQRTCRSAIGHRAAVVGASLGAAIVLALANPLAAFAVTSIDIDFTAAGYTVGAGSPAGQNGWIASGVAMDNALVDNASFPASGLGAAYRRSFSRMRRTS